MTLKIKVSVELELDPPDPALQREAEYRVAQWGERVEALIVEMLKERFPDVTITTDGDDL